MSNCENILQQLSSFLDNPAPDDSLARLQQQAEQEPGCAELFQAMLLVHASLQAAPMLAPSRDLSLSVTQALAQQQRRDKALLAGVIFFTAVLALAPILMLAWAGITALLEPGLLTAVIGGVAGFISNIATWGAAALNLLHHAPLWVVTPASAIIAMAFLLLTLIMAIQKAPEQFLIPSPSN